MRSAREPFNAWSHFAGAVLSIVGTSVLLSKATSQTAAVAFLIYGVGLFTLFMASALYHALHRGAKWLQTLDHSAIFIMIAGSYTPVTMLGIRDRLGVGMLVAQWAMAAIGISATIALGKCPTWMRLPLYLIMGWMAVFAIDPLTKTMSSAGVAWMLVGGIAYTIGAIIYAAKRPRLWPGKFGFHELWHCFVLAGAGAHFAMMLHLVGRA